MQKSTVIEPKKDVMEVKQLEVMLYQLLEPIVLLHLILNREFSHFPLVIEILELNNLFCVEQWMLLRDESK